ncbi:DUF3830 family protein [Cloacibacillus sp.]|uniref:DUF3830 family protein n=1 Tax=Cloacibacillus sp. TaxID=2049023 RepID=UPI0025BAEF28|nr:DUF3830 family protein [Cloacibacillus sp.]MCC8057116.1 DUF3830 family protein [Cloacibacillus sp.]
MSYFKFHFERGGFLTTRLRDDAASTVTSVLEIIPVESQVQHTRWCGREIYIPIKTLHLPEKENQTCVVSKFDLVYWRDWDFKDQNHAPETLSMFYGAEKLGFHGGQITVNVIGRVLWEEEKMLEAIGERIWSLGFEKVRVELLPE